MDTRLLQTVARGTDSGKAMIATATALACVINGDTMTDVLRQATWLILAITVLIIVQVVATAVSVKRLGRG
ncbi:hypothetical protein [Streptomyces sp. NBC_00474]|uniref:hypothetical protein n=1 Tax=Streptomyces sp. NBC_00474 TaxID=2975754 RepID=UPI00225A3CB8|nr:hypothetical protein [Streptomyces sp. NBC_00474]MCX5049543.1 hypothetical protein [Streptomyces sp. NBC_00474]